MTPEQRYIFNVSGYLHIKNALTPEELRNAQDAVRRYMNTPPEEMPVGCSRGMTTEASTSGYANAFAFNKALEHLVMHQATWPIIKELSADKPRMAPGGNSLRISTHENPALPFHTLREPIHQDNPRIPNWKGWRGQKTRHDFDEPGGAYCDFSVVFWYMTDVLPGDGGLVMVPGSHKSEFARSQEVSDYLFNNGQYLPDGSLPQGVVQPTIKAGDVVIITEELVHGTLKWKPKNRDRIFVQMRHVPQHLLAQDGGVREHPQELMDRLAPETRELMEVAPIEHTKKIVKLDSVPLN